MLYVNEDMVKLQINVAKSNDEGIDNVPDPVYSSNIWEREVAK